MTAARTGQYAFWALHRPQLDGSDEELEDYVSVDFFNYQSNITRRAYRMLNAKTLVPRSQITRRLDDD